MKDLMLIGGLPYSGKTMLGKDLAQRQPEKYKYLGLDDYYKRAEEDGNRFFTYLKLACPQLVDSMGMGIALAAGADLNSAMQTLRTSLSTTGQKPFWEQLLKLSSMTCITDHVLQTPEGITPVVESLFFNKSNRAEFYESFKDYIEILNQALPRRPQTMPEELDSARKRIVYLDFGIDVCLARYWADPEKEKKPMICEELIRHLHANQEVPSADEWPNLEVVVIKNDTDLGAFVKKETAA